MLHIRPLLSVDEYFRVGGARGSFFLLDHIAGRSNAVFGIPGVRKRLFFAPGQNHDATTTMQLLCLHSGISDEYLVEVNQMAA